MGKSKFEAYPERLAMHRTDSALGTPHYKPGWLRAEKRALNYFIREGKSEAAVEGS
jgi:hypothetical protein